MILSERVRKVYFERFLELSEQKRFHFATRIKNFYKVHYFDDYLREHIPDTDLAPILKNNDFSNVNFIEERREYFEKYQNLYALEATLFRVLHLYNEFDIDLRAELTKMFPKEALYELCDKLLADEAALRTLSTFAVNVICLSEILYPRGIDVVQRLCNFVELGKAGNEQAMVYFVTHIILCDTFFYTRAISDSHVSIFEDLLAKCENYITENYDEVSLDIKLEYFVCTKLVGAEHRNVLLVMSGL